LEKKALRDHNLRYLEMFRPHAWKMLAGVLLSAAQGSILLPVPLRFRSILDDCLPQHDMHGLALAGLFIVLLYLANLALQVSSKYLVLRVTKDVVMKLRADTVNKLQQLSISFYDSEDLGRLHSQIIQDSEKVDVMSNFAISVLLVSLVQALGTLVLMFKMHWQLSLLVCVVAVIFWGTQHAFKSSIKKRYKAWRDEFDAFSAKVQQLISAIRLVRAYATEERESGDAATIAGSLSHRGVEMVTFTAFYQGLMEFLMGISTVVVLVGGGYFMLQGSLSQGQLVAFYLYLATLFGPVRNVLMNVDQLFGGQVALEQLYHLLDHVNVEPDREKGLNQPIRGRVEFKQVGFGYSAAAPVLKQISVSVSPGQTVALVGHSGAGKSTFINILLGFYAPQEGRVLIDDLDQKEFQSKCLRSQMAVVAQENLLQPGTVRSNIMYGKPEASQAEMEAAAGLACAHDFIQDLPSGYDTEVGERGVKLSGGQRQRIGIARAILRNPRILILDEATSALDTRSEKSVQKALENLKAHRTTFVIAHRLSTVKNADLILVFDKGEIKERGSHQELLNQNQIYARLFGAQFEAA
jgi:ABC-type multidrug transport system fused ATPase/permease subunit